MKDHKRKGTGIFGDTEAFGSAFEEQGKETLHVHMMVWVGALQKGLERLFNTDGSVNDEMKFSLLNYVNLIMSS